MQEISETVLKSLISQLFQEPEDPINQELESQRIYFRARLELLQERIEYLRQTVNNSVKEETHHISPLSFGYVEGLRHALAVVSNYTVSGLKKPLTWWKDPEIERRIRLSSKYKREVRRRLARHLWYAIGAKYYQNTSNYSVFKAENSVFYVIKDVLSAIPPAYKYRSSHKYLLKLMGVTNEKMQNAEPLEDWWT